MPNSSDGPELVHDLDLPAAMFQSGGPLEPVVLTMAKLITGPVNVDANFSVIDDLAIHQGDIVLGPADEVRNPSRDRGIGITRDDYRWPNGVIPYVCQPELRPRVDAAIQHWQKHTPFRFPPRTNENEYISFIARRGCQSMIGRQRGGQVISRGGGCGIGSAIHEIGHAVGLFHEQSRADRDRYVEILWDNIEPDQYGNFDQYVQTSDDLGKYDFGSIMHYPPNAFSRNGRPTIQVRGGQSIGQRNGLSKGDITAVKKMYPDLNWPAH